MIPSFTLSGVLPPFETNPTVDAGRSPYLVTPDELVAQFATSDERNALLGGLFQYRSLLRKAGMIKGFQWIDGSFVEDTETLRGRAPKDIDLVTFAHRPLGARDTQAWHKFVKSNPTIFNASALGLDAFYVDLELEPKVLVRRSAYWFGLFSHQRVTALWKGMLQIDLAVDDASAVALLGAKP